MGGRGSGGRRTGSGRKRHSDLERAILGDPGKRGVVLQHPNAPAPSTEVAPVEAFGPPARLRGKARAIWLELAPAAFEARTLTPGSSAAFAMLCRAAVHERALSASKRFACGPNHRGLMQRVGSWMKDFGIAPLGKPIYVAAPVVVANPLDRFTKARA